MAFRPMRPAANGKLSVRWPVTGEGRRGTAGGDISGL